MDDITRKIREQQNVLVINIQKSFSEEIDIEKTAGEEKDPKKAKIAKVMAEWKAGTLKSSSGDKVTDHDQAVAIAMSEAEKIEKSEDGEEVDDDVEKAIDEEALYRALGVDIEKSKAEPSGTIKEWGGKKYQKQSDGKWRPVKKEKGSSKEEESKDSGELAKAQADLAKIRAQAKELIDKGALIPNGLLRRLMDKQDEVTELSKTRTPKNKLGDIERGFLEKYPDAVIVYKKNKSGDEIVYVNGQTAYNREDYHNASTHEYSLLRAYKASGGKEKEEEFSEVIPKERPKVKVYPTRNTIGGGLLAEVPPELQQATTWYVKSLQNISPGVKNLVKEVLAQTKRKEEYSRNIPIVMGSRAFTLYSRHGEWRIGAGGNFASSGAVVKEFLPRLFKELEHEQHSGAAGAQVSNFSSEG